MVEPVTVVVRRAVRTGRERGSEARLERLRSDAATLPIRLDASAHARPRALHVPKEKNG